MKENLTELVFILDRSGSMEGLEADTVGGFNAMLRKQREQEGEAYVSTVLFNQESHVLHDRLPLSQVPDMTRKDYQVGGCTALIDAIGGAIKHISTIHKYARPEDVPAHTMFVITTDGMENVSRQFTANQVHRMIKRQKKTHGWEFLFIGANIDAVETASQYGIDESRAVNYHADKKGTRVLYDCLSVPISAMRAGQTLDETWCEEIATDFKNRK